jgi:hypothetical protein
MWVNGLGGAGVLAVLVGGALYGSDVPAVQVSSQPPAVLYHPPTSTDTWRTVANSAFTVGEDLFFVVKWGVVTGGHSTLAIRNIETMEGRSAFHIVSEARSTGVVDAFYKTRDRNETWLDVQSLATLRYEKHIREGKYRVEQTIELDQINHRFRDYFERLDKGTTSYVEGPVPPYVMDVLGSLYYVRTLPLEVGQSFSIDVYDGKKVWPLVVKVGKREKVKVPAGKFDCFRVEPLLREPGIFIKKGKKLQVWMTADQYRMPVLMRSEVAFGHVAAELVSFHRPPPPAPPAPAAP